MARLDQKLKAFYVKNMPGMNTRKETLEHDVNYVERAQNARFQQEHGSVKKREPLRYYNETPATTEATDGVFRYYTSGGDIKLIMISGGNAYVGTDSSGATTVIRALYTSGKRAGFVVYKDLLIVGDGYNETWVYDGSADNVTWELGSCKGVLGSVGGELDAVAEYYYSVGITYAGTEYITGALSNTVTTDGTKKQIDLTNIPLGPVGTTSRQLYRTNGDGSTLKFLHTFSDNTTEEWTDKAADGGTLTGCVDSGTDLVTFTTSVAHGLQIGDRITISGTTDYNNSYTIVTVGSTTTFEITEADPFPGDQSGTWTIGETMGNVTDEVPKGSILQLHRERLFISRDPDAHNNIYYSKPYLPHFMAHTTDLDVMKVDENDNDEIMGMPIHLGIMLCIKKNTIRRLHITGPTAGWDSSQWYAEDPHVHTGSPAQWSIVSTPYGVVYLGWDQWYIYTNQSQPVFTEFNPSCIAEERHSQTVGFWSKEIFYAAYTDSATAASYHNRVMVYDFKQKKLAFDTMDVNCFTSYVGADERGDLILGSSRTGTAYKAEQGIERYRLYTKDGCEGGTISDVFIGETSGEPYMEIGTSQSAAEIPDDVCVFWDNENTTPGTGWTEVSLKKADDYTSGTFELVATSGCVDFDVAESKCLRADYGTATSWIFSGYPFTFEATFSTTAATTQCLVSISATDVGADQKIYSGIFMMADGTISGQASQTSPPIYTTGTKVCNDGAKHHVMCTWTATDIYVYIDGVLDSTISHSVAFMGTAWGNQWNYFNVGSLQRAIENNYYWDGKIDEVIVYDADVQSTVATRYNGGVISEARSNLSDAVAIYHLNETSGTEGANSHNTAGVDSELNGINGTPNWDTSGLVILGQITDSDDEFLNKNYAAGQMLTIRGSLRNDGTYEISTVSKGIIKLTALVAAEVCTGSITGVAYANNPIQYYATEQQEFTTSTAHGMVAGDAITITDTASYDGDFFIDYVRSPTTFVIKTPWVSSETGTWQRKITLSTPQPLIKFDTSNNPGTLAGTDLHTHALTGTTVSAYGALSNVGNSGMGKVFTASHTHTVSGTSNEGIAVPRNFGLRLFKKNSTTTEYVLPLGSICLWDGATAPGGWQGINSTYDGYYARLGKTGLLVTQSTAHTHPIAFLTDAASAGSLYCDAHGSTSMEDIHQHLITGTTDSESPDWEEDFVEFRFIKRVGDEDSWDGTSQYVYSLFYAPQTTAASNGFTDITSTYASRLLKAGNGAIDVGAGQDGEHEHTVAQLTTGKWWHSYGGGGDQQQAGGRHAHEILFEETGETDPAAPPTMSFRLVRKIYGQNSDYNDASTVSYTSGIWTSPAMQISAESMGSWYWNKIITGADNIEIFSRTAATSAVATETAITTVDHTTETFTLVGHGLTDGDRVTIGGTVIPIGLSDAVMYYVVGVAGNDFQVSLTSGGSAAAFTSNGTDVTFKRWVGPHSESNGTPALSAANVWLQYVIVFTAVDTQITNPRVYYSNQFIVKLEYVRASTIAETSVLFVYQIGCRNFSTPSRDKIYKKLVLIHEVEASLPGSVIVSWETENASDSFTVDLDTSRIKWESFFQSTAMGRKLDFKFTKDDLVNYTLKEVQGVYTYMPLIA